MTVVGRTFVLGLAVLLTAATAAADTAITADEVIRCWEVEPAGSDSVSFTLPRLERRTLSTFDIYEVRLADSSRVAELSTRLPQLRVVLDSGQPVPPPAVRAREMIRHRLKQTREARAEGFPGHADVVDTLPLRTSPAELVARCRDMDIALCERGQDDGAVAGLRREVLSEQAALRRIWPQQGTCCLSGMLGGGLGVIVGGALGLVVVQPVIYGDPVFWDCGGGPVGAVVGCAVGSAIGVAIDLADNGRILARHRDHVNDLVRRVNRAVASQP